MLYVSLLRTPVLYLPYCCSWMRAKISKLFMVLATAGDVLSAAAPT